jgi:energy-coupling factor transporter ATP-binding protein EcfA2
MRLTRVTLSKFKNFLNPQTIEIEDDVTCLVGKNESGKTTILKALHRLNPANGDDREFDATTEYPRWRLSRDRRGGGLGKVEPVVAEFQLDEDDIAALTPALGVSPPASALIIAARNYDNELVLGIRVDAEDVILAAAEDASVDHARAAELANQGDIDAASAYAANQAKRLKDAGDTAVAKAFASFGTALKKYAVLLNRELPDEAVDIVGRRLPRFFYFSNYDKLPGECDLTDLAERWKSHGALRDEERTVIALLAHAGETPDDFLDDNYDSRKAELQAASGDLSRRAFEYWQQNTDLEVVFDTDMPVVGTDAQGWEIRHRVLKIELRDGRHGGVETNFATRSSGFQWFFSFFAAFSEYQELNDPIIVLLDEPGTSLHGEAQKDFVRFVFKELGSSKQTLYTTHSQYLVDPSRYEKLRAVHDRATRDNPELGVVVTRVDLSADKDTVLPVESALGYTVSQHLFIGGGHHLAVEGSSDFVYLQRVSEHVAANGGAALDPRLAAIPVGGDSNMPAFVALLGRRLKVSALIDGDRASTKYQRVLSAAQANGVPETSVVVVADAGDLPTNADIEDLFDPEDYLRLYNWALGASATKADLAATEEPILRRLESKYGKFDHALPAHTLTERRTEFFASVKPRTVERFEMLFKLLNASLEQ